MGKWRAVDAVESSLEETKSLILPFRISRWLKLALIVFLAGAGGVSFPFNPIDFDIPSSILSRDTNSGLLSQYGSLGVPEQLLWNLLTGWLPLIIFLVFLLLLISVLWLVVSNIFTFVFVDAAVKKDVQIREPFSKNIGRGLVLLLFKFALLISIVVLLAILTIPAVLSFVVGSDTAVFLGVAYAVMLTFFLIFLIITAALVYMFTSDFVVPAMYLTGRGVLDSWRHIFSLIRKNFWQFALYVPLKIGLGIAAGIVVLLVMIPFAIALLITALPFILIAMFSGIGSPEPSIGIVAILLILAFFVILLVSYLFTAFTLPIPVFFRYYSLTFLGKIDKALDFKKYKE